VAGESARFISVLGWAWNLPNTLLGLLIGLSNPSLPHVSHGAINFDLRGGWIALLCNRLGVSAFTVGDCVLYACTPTDRLRVHESRHIAQYRLFGPFFLPVYFLLLLVFGYRNHPLERDATACEASALRDGRDSSNG
jgi:hypothetical protein